MKRIPWATVAAAVALASVGACTPRDDCRTAGLPCFERKMQEERAAIQSAKLAKEQVRAQCMPAQPFAVPPSAREWTSASKPKDGAVFAFRGNRIGDPIGRLFPCHDRPDLTKGWSPLETPVSTCIASNVVPGRKSCEDYSTYRDAYTWIGPVPTMGITYEYLNDRLTGFTVMMQGRSWLSMSAMLKDKYGPPTTSARGTVQNAMGATFDAMTETWATPDGQLVLRSRYPLIDGAHLEFTNPEAERVKAQYQDQARKAQSKGAL